MAKNDVQVKFSLLDGVTSGLKGIVGGLGSVSGAVAKIGAVAGAAATAIAGIGLGSFFSSAISSAADFQSQINRVGAVTGATTEELGALKAAAEAASAATGFGAQESGAALERLARAGLSATEAASALTPALNLAKAGALETGQAAELLADTLDQFGLAGDQAGAVADKLAKAALSSGTGIGQMAAAFTQAAPAARQAGLSFEQTAAAIGLLAKQGIEGSRAGGALRAVLQELGDPSSRFAAALTELGIKSRDFGDVLAALAGKGKAGEVALATLSDRGKAAMQALLREGGGALQGLQAELANASGAASQAADAMSSDLTGAFKAFQNAFDEFRRALVEPLLEPLREEIDLAADKLREFAKTPAFEELRQAIRELFVQGAQFVKNFVAEFDFKAAIDAIKAFAGDARENFQDISAAATTTAAGVKLAFDGVSATFNAFIGTVSAAASAITKLAEVSFTAAALVSDDAAEIQAQLGEISARAAENARAAFERAQTAAQGLAEGLSAAGTAAAGAAPGIAGAGASAAGTAEQLAAVAPAAAQVGDALAGVDLAAQRAVGGLSGAVDTVGELQAKLARLTAELGTQIQAGASAEALAPLEAQIKSTSAELDKLNQVAAETGAQLPPALGAGKDAALGMAQAAGEAASEFEKAAASAGQVGPQAAASADQSTTALGGIIGLLLQMNQRFAATSENARQLFVDMYNSAVRAEVSIHGVVRAIFSAAEATERAIQAQKTSASGIGAIYDEIAEKGAEAGASFERAFKGGEAQLQAFAAAVREGRSSINLLNKADLDALAASIDRAAAKVAQLKAEAVAAAQELRDMASAINEEILRASGDEEAIAKLNFDKQIERINKLASKAGEANFAAAQEAKAAAERAYREELERIRKRKAAQIQADREAAEARAEANARADQQGSTGSPAPDLPSASSGGVARDTVGGRSALEAGGRGGKTTAPAFAPKIEVKGSVIGTDPSRLAAELYRLIRPAIEREARNRR